MAIFATKTYSINTPLSESDSFYEDFEYMLLWVAPGGGYMQYLFTSWSIKDEIDSTTINSNTTNISRLIKTHKNFITVYAEDVELNDFVALKTILSAKEVRRLKKDGTTEKIVSIGKELAYINTAGQYNLQIDLQLQDTNTFR